MSDQFDDLDGKKDEKGKTKKFEIRELKTYIYQSLKLPHLIGIPFSTYAILDFLGW